MELACSKCHKVYRDIEKCPACNIDLTRDWASKIALIDPENSRIAKDVKITSKGIYALKT